MVKRMVDYPIKEQYDIHDLVKIMQILRSDQGCPWDRAQDHHSIRANFIEEVYEAVEAIDNEDRALLKEELGDVLLQVVFHARLEEEAGSFDFAEVCDGICKKLLFRHPHVFGSVQAGNEAEALKSWEQAKKEEKKPQSAAETLRQVPRVLPALMRSAKVQGRAAKAGFDYPDLAMAMRDLESELLELKEAVGEGSPAHIREELGDLLFSVVNISRFLEVEPEESLNRSCDKFISRFSEVERLADAQGIPLKGSDIAVLDSLWKQAKNKEIKNTEGYENDKS